MLLALPTSPLPCFCSSLVYGAAGVSSDISICIQMAPVISSVNVQAVNNVNEVNIIDVSYGVKPNCPTFLGHTSLVRFLIQVSANSWEFPCKHVSISGVMVGAARFSCRVAVRIPVKR